MPTSAAKLPRKISEYVQQHVFVTGSGIVSQRYLRWALEILGPDRLLFATDYPFAPTPRGMACAFLEAAQLNEAGRTKIASDNWHKLSGQICH